MTAGAAEAYRRIAEAAERRAKVEALQAITGLTRGPHAEGDGAAPERAMKALIDQRWFDLAEQLGEWLVRQRPDVAGVRRRYGQALLERGRFASAREHFEQLLLSPSFPRRERVEAAGLIGRAFKQQFVDQERATGQGDPELLRRAIDQYLCGYLEDAENTWHGINAVALLDLAERRGVLHDARQDRASVAQAILDTLELASGRSGWDEATLAEACVALQRWDEAAVHLRRYLWYPDTNAFHFASTLRELEEIWGLAEPGHPGEPLVTLLRARLLEVENGAVHVAPADVRATLQHANRHYEKVFGADHFVTLTNYRLGLERCAAVARIGPDVDRGQGTGFVMRGSDLVASLGPDVVLITNAHVVDPTPDRRSEGFRPADVRVSFQNLAGVDPAHAFDIAGVIWSSPRADLDVTIALLDGTLPLGSSYPLAAQLPAIGARLRAIGHPGGGTLSFSLNDNEFLDYEGHLLHYRTPTEGGSSGSPVFTQDWKLVALHHAGRDDMPRLNGRPGTYEANEGISIGSIRQALGEAITAGRARSAGR